MSESSTSVPSESDSPSTDPAEDILATSWSDVLEQFWIVQQKEAVAFYHGRVEPERKTWPAPLLDVPLDFVADCVEDELRDERQTVGKEALSMIALAAHVRNFFFPCFLGSKRAFSDGKLHQKWSHWCCETLSRNFGSCF